MARRPTSARLYTTSPTWLLCKLKLDEKEKEKMVTDFSRFGPNTFPANNSALYACEVQVDYAAKALVKPLINGQASTIEVKEAVENYTTNQIHEKLKSSVFSGDCSNWYIGDFGRNVASWPGLAIEFWIATLFPDSNAFIKSGGSHSWLYKSLLRTSSCSRRTC